MSVRINSFVVRSFPDTKSESSADRLCAEIEHSHAMEESKRTAALIRRDAMVEV